MAKAKAKAEAKKQKQEINVGGLTRMEKEKLFLLLEEKERREDIKRCKKDCLHFISTHIRIEDRDEAVTPMSDMDLPEYFVGDYEDKPDGIAVPFILWDGQKKALETFLKKRLIIALKARQLGFTWLGLAYAVWRMVFFHGIRL